MRRALLFISFLTMVLAMWAGDVSPEQALKQAQNFVLNQVTAGRRAPGATPQLALKGTVSGLYVFNVADDEGFVIVSNDDVAIPILGYSDSGSIDPNNMPANMRAWLQGYADEIAWAKKVGIKKSASPTTSTSRRAGSHSTATIPTLLSTHWDQRAPYYNNCPVAPPGYRCLTGCVATAMAQVMNKHQWPAGTTQIIPNYTWEKYTKYMNDGKTYGPGELGTTTFDWANMEDTYDGTETDATATAVATLMRYCGQSVKMDYWFNASSASVPEVASALKTYFNYSSTTQYLSRSSYSYADWTDIIYYELSQGRPVIYGGQSTDNGHCFVCDGYMYDGGDLFHINWGWSGTSDGYFVLSVLDPKNQGSGGSATNASYNFGQEAVVGIQKYGVEDPVSTLVEYGKITISLALNSTAASHATIALGESINVTVNVTNNSKDSNEEGVAYDGEICLMVNGGLGVGKMFEIASGAKQDCVITFTPSEIGSYTLGAAYPSSEGGYFYEENLGGTFTVVDQTPTNLTVTETGSITATMGWTNVGEASKWNLRTRPVTLEDFNGEVSGWVADYRYKWSEKGGWELSSTGGIDGSQCYVSPSYYNGEDLNPDVGLGTPEFTLGGSIAFYAWGEDEHFIVYITNGTNLTSISQEIIATAVATRYSFDLSKYAGQTGRIVIVHCNSGGHTSDSFLHVDNVQFVDPSFEWTTVNDITTPSCTVSHLKPESSYEAQVQAVNNDGGKWSSTAIFTTTTLALLNDDSGATTKNTELIADCDGITTNVTLSGRTVAGKDQWNTFCLPFNISTSALATYFGAILSKEVTVTARVLDTENTSLSSEGELTLRFTDATNIPAGTPFIMKCDTETESIDLSSHPISATIDGSQTANARKEQTSNDGKVMFVGQWSTFDITDANLNEIVYIGSNNRIGYSKSPRTLKCMRAHFWIQPKATGAPALTSIYVDFGDGETTSIDLTNADSNEQSTGWYTIDGVKLSGEPAQKGLYIYNGKKVIK